MKKIIVTTLKECFSYIMESEEKYSIIHISDENSCAVKFTETEKCIESMKISFDKYTLYHADQIIRFCERQFDIDTVIITSEESSNIVFNLIMALKDNYGVTVEYFKYDDDSEDDKNYKYDKYFKADYDFEEDDEDSEIYKDDSFQMIMKLKYIEIKNSLLNTLSPMDYCLKIIEFTLNQVKEYIDGRCACHYGSSEFFWYRQCDIYLKNGTTMSWHLESTFSNIIFPELSEIEYVRFSGVPEIAPAGSFKNVYDYCDDCRFGIYDLYGREFEFNSRDGIIRRKDSNLPDKYQNYRYIQREWYEFSENGRNVIFPETENAFGGMLAAEKFLKEKIGYTPRFTDIPLYHTEEIPIYSRDYRDIFDTIMNAMSLAEIWEYDKLEYLCAYAAYIYTGILCDCGHCENLSMLREIFSKAFYDNEKLPLFDKVWKIADTDEKDLVIDGDPINMLCIAIYSLITTVRPYAERKIPKGIYSDCLKKAFELTEGRPELANAVIMTGAFAGIYCQDSAIRE